MTILESTDLGQVARRSRGPRALVVVVATIVIVGVAVLAWIATNDEGPVPADEAQIEITFTGDGTSFVGDRKIIEGTVTVTFSNETDGPAIVAIFGYKTGSAALAQDLKLLEEGKSIVTGDPPTAGYFEVDFEALGDYVPPGSHTWTMDLEPDNTYLFDVGPEGFHTKGIWRMAVIEVVAE